MIDPTFLQWARTLALAANEAIGIDPSRRRLFNDIRILKDLRKAQIVILLVFPDVGGKGWDARAFQPYLVFRYSTAALY